MIRAGVLVLLVVLVALVGVRPTSAQLHNPNTTITVTSGASATGGYTKAAWTAQTTTVRTVKGSAGKLGGYYIYNPNTSVAYVQLFDTASSVTLGTTVPDVVLGIPASAGANLLNDTGIDFTTGIKFAVTTTATGNTAPSTGLDLTLFYK
jgi:hypothetical protein